MALEHEAVEVNPGSKVNMPFAQSPRTSTTYDMQTLFRWEERMDMSYAETATFGPSTVDDIIGSSTVVPSGMVRVAKVEAMMWL